MAYISQENEDNTDLTEIIAAVWSHKILIGLFTTFGIFLGGYSALTTPSTFTAKVLFQIDASNNNGGINLPSELGALAAIAGFGGAVESNNETLIERLSSREFILLSNKFINFENDKFFNNYQPHSSKNSWKSSIKNFLEIEETVQDKKCNSGKRNRKL